MTSRAQIDGYQMLPPHVAWYRPARQPLACCNGATIAGSAAALYVARVRLTRPMLSRGLLVLRAKGDYNASAVSATMKFLPGLTRYLG